METGASQTEPREPNVLLVVMRDESIGSLLNNNNNFQRSLPIRCRVMQILLPKEEAARASRETLGLGRGFR